MSFRSLFAVLMTLVLAQVVQAGDDLPSLVKRLKSGDQRAIPELVKHGGDAIAPLLPMIGANASVNEQSMALAVLAQIVEKAGGKAKGAVEPLCKILEKPSDGNASAAATTLGLIGGDAAPALVKIVREGDSATSIYAARALRIIGPPGKDAAGPLAKKLGAKLPVQEQVAYLEALAAIGPGSKSAVKQIVALGEAQPKAPHLVHLVATLGRIGPDAEEAIPYLMEVLAKGQPPFLRLHALEALGKIGVKSKDLTAKLALQLKEPSIPRDLILEALCRAGSVDKETALSLQNVLRDPSPRTRLYAARIIGKVDADHPATVSVLLDSLAEKDADLRRLAAETLGEIRPRDEAVLEALQKTTADPDPAVSRAATQALERLKRKT